MSRILIIEDEKRLADALGQIMQEARYQADIVYDGRDGLAYASSGDYDVIVLDVMLPDMDGFTLCQRIREDHLFPIIMLTAKSETEDKVNGLKQGAEGPDAEESGDAFFAYRHQDVAGAFLFQTGHQASASGNDDIFHAPGRKAAAQFHNDLFHASGFHGGDEMYYFHKARS